MKDLPLSPASGSTFSPGCTADFVRHRILPSMMGAMGTSSQGHEVLGAVVQPITVDMVDTFIRQKAPPVGLLPHKAMLCDPAIFLRGGMVGEPEHAVATIDSGQEMHLRRFRGTSLVPIDIVLLPSSAQLSQFTTTTSAGKRLWSGRCPVVPRCLMGWLQVMAVNIFRGSVFVLRAIGNRLITAARTSCRRFWCISDASLKALNSWSQVVEAKKVRRLVFMPPLLWDGLAATAFANTHSWIIPQRLEVG